MREMKKTDININLLENCFDYILDALRRLDDSKIDPLAIKYPIVHLWNGVELLLKKRLMDEHWSLIFNNLDDKKSKKSAIETGDFYSADYKTLVSRLKNICEIDIKPQHKDILEAIRSYRNRIVHYQFRGTYNSLVAKSVDVCNFIIEFSRKNIDMNDKEKELFNEIIWRMTTNQKIVSSRMNEIKPTLEDKLKKFNSFALKCPECFQETLPFITPEKNFDHEPYIPNLDEDYPETYKCEFCLTEFDTAELAKEWSSTWYNIDSTACVDCGCEGLCHCDEGWICFFCGQKWDSEEIKICPQCETYHYCMSDEKCRYCEETDQS